MPEGLEGSPIFLRVTTQNDSRRCEDSLASLTKDIHLNKVRVSACLSSTEWQLDDDSRFCKLEVVGQYISRDRKGQ